VWVEAWGGLELWLGETEPEPELEPESKKELLSAASWLMREESSRAPLPDVAGVDVDAAPPVWVPLRTSRERAPKPATATPADAILRSRARRRAGARREGVEEGLGEAAVDMRL
jgi:hypothetical protein